MLKFEVGVPLRHDGRGVPEDMLHLVEGTPAWTIQAAAVCRNVWNEASVMPASPIAVARPMRPRALSEV